MKKSRFMATHISVKVNNHDSVHWLPGIPLVAISGCFHEFQSPPHQQLTRQCCEGRKWEQWACFLWVTTTESLTDALHRVAGVKRGSGIVLRARPKAGTIKHQGYCQCNLITLIQVALSSVQGNWHWTPCYLMPPPLSSWHGVRFWTSQGF